MFLWGQWMYVANGNTLVFAADCSLWVSKNVNLLVVLERNIRESPKPVGFIFWGPQMSEQNFNPFSSCWDISVSMWGTDNLTAACQRCSFWTFKLQVFYAAVHGSPVSSQHGPQGYQMRKPAAGHALHPQSVWLWFQQEVSLHRSTDSPSETYCGTSSYAAPEILRSCLYNPKLSDVWSMSAMLYMMLYALMPYDASNIRSMVRIQM